MGGGLYRSKSRTDFFSGPKYILPFLSLPFPRKIGLLAPWLAQINPAALQIQLDPTQSALTKTDVGERGWLYSSHISRPSEDPGNLDPVLGKKPAAS